MKAKAPPKTTKSTKTSPDMMMMTATPKGTKPPAQPKMSMASPKKVKGC